MGFSGSFSFSLFLSPFFFISFLLVVLFRRDRESSNYIYKYSLRTEHVEAIITVGSFTPRTNSYDWGGYNGMDLAVDEQGLWVLWGSTANNKKLRASKIDVYKNVIGHTWALNTGKDIISTTLKFDRYQRGLILGLGLYLLNFPNNAVEGSAIILFEHTTGP